MLNTHTHTHTHTHSYTSGDVECSASDAYGLLASTSLNY